ncbi:MAG: M24 family metallopeptidase [Candidatus Pacebacteria bacterium]|nr:M24 family metallopeptidase [Candidatus Paceibacterota bacterium]
MKKQKTKHTRQTQCKLIHEVRAVKSKQELANIISAQRISEEVLKFIKLKVLKSGITEMEVANQIKKKFIEFGAPILAFPPIVAFGKNTANIHHEPGKAKLKVGDTVMFDFGTTVNHYCSDMTRTYFWGEPNSKQKKVYLDVLKAQELAFQKLNSGEKRAGVIDNIARKFLAKKYKDNFKHGLGHGVGTVIHEWPNLKPKSEDVLPVGCVMTIEPGIYLPGFGGVRIEDMYLVTKNGAKSLTNVPKSLKDAVLK